MVSAFETNERRFQLFVFVFGTVAAMLPFVLWSIGHLAAKPYAVVVLIWLFASSEVFAPTSPDTIWWRRLQWIKIAGWIVLVYILFERVTTVV